MPLHPLWRNAVIVVLIVTFTILIWMAIRSYQEAPPIPERAVDPSGNTVFTRNDIIAGQQVFLKYGLMENGSIWGHGAYLGPDFSAAYLHTLSTDAASLIAQQRYGRAPEQLSADERGTVNTEVTQLLKKNRFDRSTGTLALSEAEATSFQKQTYHWTDYFTSTTQNRGLPSKFIADSQELRQLVAFFAWTAWASVANRPGESYSYTNNFPYDPTVGNVPTSDAILWSALSLITLLAATGAALFAFGRFNFLGWKGTTDHVHPQLIPGGLTTESQRATIKFFGVAVLLFAGQALLGGATAHFRADPGTFYGFQLSSLLPSNIARTWHLQLAIFWIAMTYVAGALFLAPALGGRDPKGQVAGLNWLFAALVVVTGGSLLGEYLGVNRLLGKAWFWLGHQGWEYLDLGRVWQILLAGGLALWVVLLYRVIRPALKDPERSGITSLFLYAAIAIPIFYLPAMFFSTTTHFTVVDTWRFWIIHLWVEGFFELFVTTMVAIIFFKLGVITQTTATRVVFLDAILYLGSGIVGTGHHWYWTGQGHITMALGALFSAMEVVPLTLLTLDAWDFVRLTRGTCDICGKVISVPHKWAFYLLISVGVWNFIGAGIFGFLINLPIVSYFEVGTILTPNHGHAAMMGVFGMLGIGLVVFALRQVASDLDWSRVERYIRISFWGLNIGLALMVVTSLFPGGVIQLRDVLLNGYWHARSTSFLDSPLVRTIEWIRMPGDLIFIGVGIMPLLYAVTKIYLVVRKTDVAKDAD